jgi:FO synthase
MSKFTTVLERSRSGALLTSEELFVLLDGDDLPAMMTAAAERRDRAHGSVVSCSRKVFIPLTQLCRDSCH